MTRYIIEYYAADESMGDTTPEDCTAFRRWAQQELVREYPAHQIAVIETPSLETVRTDDEARRNEIAEFCARLWDRCPWDWIPTTEDD